MPRDLIETKMDHKTEVTHAEGPELEAKSEENLLIERRIRRKLDQRILPIVTLIYLMAFIDRSNAGNARILGMQQDLHLEGNRFSIGLSCFYVSYIILEIPANILCRKVGPKLWIPTLAVGFGLSTVFMSFAQNYAAFIGLRFLVGCFEAGIMPGITYMLSCFYRRHELITRVGLYASVASLSGAFGGLLATVLSKIPPWGIIHTWRNIFFFEGLFTALLGVFAYFLLLDKPEDGRFFSEDERRISKSRMEADIHGSASEGHEPGYIKRAIFNTNTILVAVAAFSSLLTMNSMSLFIPSLLHAMGYNATQSQLMSVPPYVWATIVCVTVSYSSDKTKTRGLWLLGVMPVTALGFILLLTVDLLAVRYLSLFFCLTGAFTATPVLLAWSVENSAGLATRAIVASTVVSIGTSGGLLSTWTYLPSGAPKYVTGHAINLSFSVLACVLISIITVYLRWENRQRVKGRRHLRLEGLTEQEAAQLGHLHPDFRFTP